MADPTQTPPQWITVRLGDDLNWWVESTSDGPTAGDLVHGVLDPRQVAHLTQALDVYRPYGFRPEQFAEAFQVYLPESELEENQLRLVSANDTIYNTAEKLFAMPHTQSDGEGIYEAFLESLAAAHIRLLNSTHDYVQDCTEEDMFDELDAVDNDRYFSAEQLHVFDEISEILHWKPAEWDDSDNF